MLMLATVMVIGAVVIKFASEPVMMSWGNFLLGLGLGGLFPLMLSSAMDIDSDKGPLISGVCVIGSSIGVQTASFGTGLWAHFAPITTAFWIIPIGALWLWVMTWYYSRHVKQHLAASGTDKVHS
jgi:predicted MFS family arabinose efflux permease